MPSKKKSIWITFPLTLLLFFGGGLAGAQLAWYTAPDSVFAGMAGLLMLPLAFLSGFQFWIGFAILALLMYWIRRLFRSTPKSGRTLQEYVDIPPGSYAFIITSVTITGTFGLAVALFLSAHSFLYTFGAYLLTGLGYGILCWVLARNGYLPFPEEQ